MLGVAAGIIDRMRTADWQVKKARERRFELRSLVIAYRLGD